MIHQTAQAIFNQLKCMRSSSLKTPTHLSHENMMPKLSFLISGLTLSCLLTISAFSSVFAQEAKPSKEESAQKEQEPKADSTQQEVSDIDEKDEAQKPTVKTSKTLAQNQAELDRQIDNAQGKERLSLIFEDFKSAAQTYLSEAQNHRQVQNELFSLKYQDQRDRKSVV